MSSKLIDSKWRRDTTKARGSLAPQLFDLDLWKELEQIKLKRFAVATCNWEYLLEHTNCLVAYEKSAIGIPLLCGIYSEDESKRENRQNNLKLQEELGLKKVILFSFGCPTLDWIQQQQSDSEIRNDYLINYIRCARFTVMRTIWSALGLNKHNLLLNQAASYIIDLDNVVKADFDSTIARLYGNKKIILSWNSRQSPSKNFPATLSGMTLTKDGKLNTSYATNHPYKILKAGFCAFSPCNLSNIMLHLVELYSIGDNVSMIYLRLFTFYFSDQVAMLLSLKDIKETMQYEYQDSIKWIDISESKIVNLDNEKAQQIWYPKGVGIANKQN